jgi:hypothetical protein
LIGAIWATRLCGLTLGRAIFLFPVAEVRLG